jgi:hypothetical protein
MRADMSACDRVGRRLLRIGCCGSLIAAVALLPGCTVSTAGMAAPAANLGHDPAPVSVAALDGLLLPQEQLDSLLDASGLVGRYFESKMSDGQTAANDCAVAWRTAWGPVYQGSGWIAVRDQYLDNDDGDRVANKVFQAAVVFPFRVDAEAFYRKQVNAWHSCDGRRIEERYLDDPPSADAVFKLGAATEQDGMLTMPKTQEDKYSGWVCERALTIRNNVAIDVEACASHRSDEGEMVANAIAAKVSVS